MANLFVIHGHTQCQDLAFWTSPEFSENNLCELVGGYVVLLSPFTIELIGPLGLSI